MRATGKVAATHKFSGRERLSSESPTRQGRAVNLVGFEEPIVTRRSSVNEGKRASLAFIRRERELCAVLSATEAIHLYLTISISSKHIWPLIMYEAWGASRESNLFSSMRNTNTIVDFNVDFTGLSRFLFSESSKILESSITYMLIENVKRESTFDKKMAYIHLTGINGENNYFLLVYFIVRRKKPKKDYSCLASETSWPEIGRCHAGGQMGVLIWSLSTCLPFIFEVAIHIFQRGLAIPT